MAMDHDGDGRAQSLALLHATGTGCGRRNDNRRGGWRVCGGVGYTKAGTPMGRKDDAAVAQSARNETPPAGRAARAVRVAFMSVPTSFKLWREIFLRARGRIRRIREKRSNSSSRVGRWGGRMICMQASYLRVCSLRSSRT